MHEVDRLISDPIGDLDTLLAISREFSVILGLNGVYLTLIYYRYAYSLIFFYQPYCSNLYITFVLKDRFIAFFSHIFCDYFVNLCLHGFYKAVFLMHSIFFIFILWSLYFYLRYNPYIMVFTSYALAFLEWIYSYFLSYYCFCYSDYCIFLFSMRFSIIDFSR